MQGNYSEISGKVWIVSMSISSSLLSSLCGELQKNERFPNETYEKYNVKRGLRNADGTGVMAGLTRVCNVHGYVIDEGEKFPVEGKLTYRGQNIEDLVAGCVADNRFGFEEVVWLLLFGSLPTKAQLDSLRGILAEYRELPKYFAEDMIIKAPSPDIMNQLGRSVLALYSYDDKADDLTLSNVLDQALRLIARMPTLMTYAFQVKRRNYDQKSMFFHPVPSRLSTAEAILYSMRPDKSYTEEEARLLDLCLMLHAEHGGGNNSTFTTRVLSSSGTDTYATISAAIGSLKGHKHGGANIKVMQMLDAMREGIENWNNEDEVAEFIRKLIRREAGDGSGLVYGMGHAVYTLSDPRAVILKKYARDLAEERGYGDEFRLLETVERLTPDVFAQEKGNKKAMCANVDMYSGLVYRALGIPKELFTPLFAVARSAGWCAHRVEEIYTGGRIMRPAYKSLAPAAEYVPLDSRG